MKTATNSGAAAARLEQTPLNPASERDYWHVNYMTRPYYDESRSFGDYEPAYRFGWERASAMSGSTFEAAEKGLARDWKAYRGESRWSWAEVREAVRDAWMRIRRNRET